MPIELTEKAVEQIKDVIEKESLDPVKTYLRVGVKGGGCSGFTYILDLTEDVDLEKEWSFETGEVKIICDEKSYLYLNGTTIDFESSMMGQGFVFNNPNATSKCGCGASFSA